MKKIISYSLYYAHDDKYAKYAYNMVANILIAAKLFPDWHIYVYYDDTLDKEVKNFLCNTKNVVGKNMSDHWLTRYDKMMWRNLAMDEDADVVCIRDCDGWLSYREKIIFNDWIKSDKDLHIIRDHCWHAAAIGGGLWGRKNIRLDMENTMMEYFKHNALKHAAHKGADQDFLTEYIYNRYKDDTVIYIGEQHSPDGTYLPKGYHPEEKDIRHIEKLSGYSPGYDNLEVNGLSVFDAYTLNEFKCGRCSKKPHLYIGAMFNKIPPKALSIIRAELDNTR